MITGIDHAFLEQGAHSGDVIQCVHIEALQLDLVAIWVYGYIGVFTLNRLIEHTTAPDSVYQATRSYAYRFFIDEGRKRSYDQVTDAKGVITRVVYDGLNRPIREEREVIVAGDPATRLTRTLSTSRYDSAGRLIRETLYDYPPVDAGAQAPQQHALWRPAGQ
ncbi:hypothetical protein [Pseudomonas putida]|uniref:hypothetical protein n=1 Tax=Pseudomonas putida TaxID=303 RepID=UPI002156477A|nr:hypothetical protein [Pseudomonas putida]